MYLNQKELYSIYRYIQICLIEFKPNGFRRERRAKSECCLSCGDNITLTITPQRVCQMKRIQMQTQLKNNKDSAGVAVSIRHLDNK